MTHEPHEIEPFQANPAAGPYCLVCGHGVYIVGWPEVKPPFIWAHLGDETPVSLEDRVRAVLEESHEISRVGFDQEAGHYVSILSKETQIDNLVPLITSLIKSELITAYNQVAREVDNLSDALVRFAESYEPLDCEEPGEPFRIAARMAGITAFDIREKGAGK